MRRFVPILLLAFLLLPPTGARSVVWFVDGRTMEVESIEFQADRVTLHLDGGSQISLPAVRIDRSRTSTVQPAPSAAPAPGENDAWRVLAGPYAATIEQAARRHGLDPRLLAAVAQEESGFDPQAVSHKGARGLLQLMPETARRFGVSDSFDPMQNVDGGAQYLRWLLDRFSGDHELALAGYNAGEGAVDRYSGIPPFPETERYVGRVLTRFQHLGLAGTAVR